MHHSICKLLLLFVQTNDSWGKFGITLVDSLDTLWIMGLNNEFEMAKNHVNSLDFDQDYDASFFESTIRYVGGLISAYELSKDEIFLNKATELGERLLTAFNSPSGLPYSIVNVIVIFFLFLKIIITIFVNPSFPHFTTIL